MSIKPRYAYSVLTGSKKYELRRWSGVRIFRGDVIVLYASGRVRAIVGEFTAGKIMVNTPSAIWRKVSGKNTGIGREAWRYIAGSKKAMAIEVLNPIVYPRPFTLDEVREIIPGWNPPLSFKVLKEGDPLLERVIKNARSYLEKTGRAKRISLEPSEQF